MRATKATTIAAILAAYAVAGPARAQDAAGDRVNVVVVYGKDSCPASTTSEIVVCPRLDEAERYRIPPVLRDNPADTANEAWTQKVKAYEYVGRSGTMSCSPTGSGGFTGCTQALIDKAYAERDSAPELEAGRMIDAARQARLSNLDAESEAVESRVKEIEARQAADRAAVEATQDATIAGQATPTP